MEHIKFLICLILLDLITLAVLVKTVLVYEAFLYIMLSGPVTVPPIMLEVSDIVGGRNVEFISGDTLYYFTSFIRLDYEVL
jgi:hypothetical protein